MRGSELLDKIESIDLKYVNDARQGVVVARPGKRRLIALAAATLAVVIIAAVPLTVLYMKRSYTRPGLPVDDARDVSGLSVEYVGSLWGDSYENGTKQYKRVCVPGAAELSYDGVPIPESGKLLVYAKSEASVPLAAEELSEWTTRRKALLEEMLGSKILFGGTEYVHYDSHYDSDESQLFHIRFDKQGEVGGWFTQTDIYHAISIVRMAPGVLVIDGKPVRADQRKSDEEIRNDLEDLRARLCALLGRDLPDTLVTRTYDESSDGCKSVTVTFYNESDHPLNAFSQIVSDRIVIRFTNGRGDFGDEADASKTLDYAKIQIYSLRLDAKDLFRKIEERDMISDSQARELLEKGYVFGGHSCPLCMARQMEVDFTDSDKALLAYVDGFPFYAFYKKIGTGTNGCEIYARTYVPAILLEGIEEYFESQKSKHVFWMGPVFGGCN